MLLGCFSSDMALRYSMIFLPSMGRFGSCLALAPVAMMMWLAEYSVFLPSAAVTSTFLPRSNFPVPSMAVILFFRKRNWMPLLMPSATPRLRFTMLSKSGLALSTVMP